MSSHIVLAKSAMKSKTIWVNVIAGLAAAVSALVIALPSVQTSLTPKLFLVLTGLMAALNIWLRMITAAPLRGSPISDAGDEIGDPDQRKV